MTKGDTEKLIRKRITKSHNLLFEAEQIFKLEFYETCINRIYYSCFYMVMALLLKDGKNPKTHSGTQKLFHQFFLDKKLLDQELIRFFSEIGGLRGNADYEFDNEFDKATTYKNLEKAKIFIVEIEKLINQGT